MTERIPPEQRPGLAGRVVRFLGATGPKLLKDLLSLVLGQFATMVLGFVAFSYLARRLDTGTYGTLEFIVSLAAFAAIVIECGVGMIAVREAARNDADLSRIASAAVAARGLLAIVVVPAFVAGIFVMELAPAAAGLMLLYALSLLMFPFKQDWLLQSQERMCLAALGQPLRGAVFAGIVILLVDGTKSVIMAGVAEVASVAVLMAYYIGAQRALGIQFAWSAVSGRTLFYLREGLAIGFSNILWAFMIYAPMFFLVLLDGGTEDTAWLGASQRLVIAIVTTSFLYHFNLYPVVTRTLMHDRPRWQRIIQASIHLTAWAGIAVALGIAGFADAIMALIFGDRFAAAGPVLAVLVWAFPLRLLSGHARWSLVADGQQNWLLGSEICGAAALIVTALLAIPNLGAVGAALSLLAGITVSGAITQYRAESRLGSFGLGPSVLPPVLAALAAALATLFLPIGPAGQLASGAAIFASATLPQSRRLWQDLRSVAYAKSDMTAGSS